MVYASQRPSLEWNGSSRTQLGYLAVTWGRRQETAVRQIDLLCAPQAMAATVLAAVPNGGYRSSSGTQRKLQSVTNAQRLRTPDRLIHG